MSKKSKQLRLRRAELGKAVEELGEIRAELLDAYRKFDAVTDPSATETCIYEISALRSRYNCAVRNVKSLYI